jgi:hypothetical protein
LLAFSPVLFVAQQPASSVLAHGKGAYHETLDSGSEIFHGSHFERMRPEQPGRSSGISDVVVFAARIHWQSLSNCFHVEGAYGGSSEAKVPADRGRKTIERPVKSMDIL